MEREIARRLMEIASEKAKLEKEERELKERWLRTGRDEFRLEEEGKLIVLKRKQRNFLKVLDEEAVHSVVGGSVLVVSPKLLWERLSKDPSAYADLLSRGAIAVDRAEYVELRVRDDDSVPLS